MNPKILINGSTGRMGRITVNTIQNEEKLDLVGQASSSDDLAKTIKKTQPDIVIDFTRADAALQNLSTILESGTRAVIGTSGLTQKDITETQLKFPDIGAIIAPNFSIAAVLAMQYAGEIARYFPKSEIIEMHHDGKLDSPSGTAIRAAEILAKNHHIKAPLEKSKETIKHARGATHESVPIHAIRLPGLVANIEIIFGSQGETLTLKHSTIDRQCFMQGVVLACKKVMTLNKIVYGLENIL